MTTTKITSMERKRQSMTAPRYPRDGKFYSLSNNNAKLLASWSACDNSHTINPFTDDVKHRTFTTTA
jgi:hypothetical protein